MKIKVRSSINGLIQELDITTAGCGSLCPETPPQPSNCENGFLLADGLHISAAGRFEQFSRLGSTYGAAGAAGAVYVIGYLTASPDFDCQIEPPGTSSLFIELFFESQQMPTAGVIYDEVTGFYFVTFPEGLGLTAANGCLQFGSGVCNSSGS